MSTINLLPEDYLRRRVRRRANAIALFLIAAVLVGVAGAYLVTERNFQYTLQVRQQVENEYVEATRKIEQMQTLEQQKQKLLQKAEEASVLQERIPRSYLLAVLTNACPAYTSLQEVALQMKRVQRAATRPRHGPSAKFASKTGKPLPNDQPECTIELRVTGLASTDVEVARFIASLQRNTMFRQVDLVYSQEELIDRRIPCRKFQVLMDLRMDVDVLDLVERNLHAVPDVEGEPDPNQGPATPAWRPIARADAPVRFVVLPTVNTPGEER